MKKKIVKKVKSKKKVVKKSVPKKVTQELVIRVQPQIEQPSVKDLEPIKEKSKFMLPVTWMSEKQVIQMVQKTPAQHIYTRPGKGGQKWSYVTGNYVEKVLNFTFGWNWDFEIVAHGKEGDQVWVQGKLIVKDDKGHSITKSQFGRADIKFLKGTKTALDFGNDLKSASTDALKKCASLLGIASDVYGKAEFKQDAGKDLDVVPKEDLVSGPGGEPTPVCKSCGDPITEQEYTFSKRIFGKPLCRECQPSKK